MPELPDVEAFRRHLAATSLHRDIDRVRVTDQTSLRGVSGAGLRRALTGRELSSTARHGKHLFAHVTADAGWLVMHFGMTGYLRHLAEADAEPPHTRLTVYFTDGSRLAYVDQRRLGHVGLTDDPESFVAGEGLGHDALSLTRTQLRDALLTRRGAVKTTLMDQAVVAGIGNIYSDEILFQARIHPRASTQALDGSAYARLHRQTRRVLQLAADRDADPAALPRTWLLPHREDGAPCPRGRGEVRRFQASGRGAYYCPTCQPA